MRPTLVVLLLAGLLTACSAPAPSPESPRAEQAIDYAHARAVEDLERTDAVAPRLTVDRLAIRDVALVTLGLNRDRTIEVPPVTRPDLVGWYRYARRPGEVGPAVILGHVNGGGRPGAFAHLDRMRVGDRITTSDGGRTATFRVTRTARVPKARFPTSAVYGRTAGPELRLITCGGAFNGEDYVDNTIVWAELDGGR